MIRRATAVARAASMCALLLCPAGFASAQTWRPDGTVEFIVPAGPGGALDQLARVMKQAIDDGRMLAVPFVVVNRPGGAGKIAFDALAQRGRDGQALSFSTHGYLSSHLTGALDILPHRDLTPIALLLDEFVTVAVRPDSALKNARDLVASLKRDPGAQRIAVATSIGNHIHVGIAKPLKDAGVDIRRLTIVPFRSSADSVTALLGGHLEVVSASTPNVVALHSSGRVRLLAVGAERRLGGALADIPTWREQGIDSVFRSSLGVVGAKGLSPAQIAFWEDLLRRLTETEDWRRALERNQSQPHLLGHAETLAYYEREYESMRALIGEMGLAKQ